MSKTEDSTDEVQMEDNTNREATRRTMLSTTADIVSDDRASQADGGEDRDPQEWGADNPSIPVSRRSILKGTGLAGALAVVPGMASAQQLQTKDYCEWEFGVDAQNHKLINLKSLGFADGTSIDSANDIGGGSGDPVDVLDDGATVLDDVGDLNMGSNLSATDDGGGQVTVDAASGGALTDSGSDNSAGGDQYQLPQAADSIDLEGQGGIQNGGPAEFGSINEAVFISPSDDPNTRISELPTTGGLAIFEPGTHTITSPVTDNGTSSLTLDGYGPASKLKVADSTQINCIEPSSDRVRIRNLQIDGNKANNSDGGDRSNQCGIYLDAVNDAVVENCYIHDTIFTAIRSQAGDQDIEQFVARDNRIEDVLFKIGNVRDGISVSVNGTGSHEIVKVHNNRLSEIGTWAIEVADNAEYVTITENIVRSKNYGSGLQPHNSASKCVVSGNVVELSGPTSDCGPGIRPAGSPDEIIISDNVIHVAGAEGIGLNDGSSAAGISIVDNQVHDVAEDGIINGHDDAIINGNGVFNAGGDGIVNSGADVILTENRIRGSGGSSINNSGAGGKSFGNITGDPN
jgi:hypothetical protein